jgi:RecB family endonuclease NucS
LVLDSEPNAALKRWGREKLNQISREWSDKRRKDNERRLQQNPIYQKFLKEADAIDSATVKRVADRLIKDVIAENPIGNEAAQESAVQMCIDFMQFNAFSELAQEVSDAEVKDVGRLLDLFREWEVVEAKEMMRVTEGRIKTIQKLEELIRTNALEVPTLHNFLKEFPWVLDPRWTLVADEKRYSQLLRNQFPEEAETLENDKRIDFLCVRESTSLIVVEIKRPQSKASSKELDQIEEYVIFMRDYVLKTNAPDLRMRDVVGYLLCGDLVNTPQVTGRRNNLEAAKIYVRKYNDLLMLVEANHKEFLARYSELRQAKLERLKSNETVNATP